MRTSQSAFSALAGTPSGSRSNARFSRRRLKNHFESEALQTLRQALPRSFRIQLIEKLTAQFTIDSAIPKQVVGDDQYLMRRGDDRFFHAMPARPAVERSR